MEIKDKIENINNQLQRMTESINNDKSASVYVILYRKQPKT